MRNLTVFRIVAGMAALALAGLLIQRSRPAAGQPAQPPDIGLAPNEALAAVRPASISGRRAAFTTTSVLVLTLILLLGSLGVVYGTWSKNLTVAGVVESGDLSAQWDKVGTQDICGKTSTTEAPAVSGESVQTSGGNHDDGHGADDPCQPNSCSNHSFQTDACTPTCDASIGGVGGDSVFGNQVAYVDIENATPGYWCEVKGWVSNTGSIPFNIVGVNGVLDARNDEGLSFYDLNGGQASACKLVDKHGNTVTDPQVDPGEDTVAVCKIVIDQEVKTCKTWHQGDCTAWEYSDAAKYGWTYHFAIEVCVAQWNEDPSTGGPPEDFAACKSPSPGTHEGPTMTALPTPGSGH